MKEYQSTLEKGNPTVYGNMDEPGGHCAKKNKLVSKGWILYDFFLWGI